MRTGTRLRRCFVALVVLGIAAGTVFLPAEAGADQISDKKAEAEAIAKKIKDLDREIERAAEEANGAQIELDGINRDIDTAQADVAAAEQSQAARRSELTTYAIDAYVHGDRATLIDAGAGDFTTLGQRQGYLAAASSNRQSLIDSLRASQEDLEIKIGELNEARGQAETKTQLLADRKTRAESAVAQQNDLYNRAQGELATLVAEAQRQEAARQEASARARQAQRAISAPAAGAGPAVRGGVDAVIEEAKRQLGKPYRWGAAGPDSFDCSGLTQWAWRAGGVGLPHYSGAQYSSTTHVSMSSIRPGDLIFYEDPSSHVALYVGNGTIIHAPNSRSVVRYDSLYYWDTWMAASRP